MLKLTCSSTGSLSNELYQCSDVALLCEEIVYGMMAAKEFTGVMESSSAHRPGSYHSGHSHDSRVHIILDFEHRNWKYRIQSGEFFAFMLFETTLIAPGAIRRIIMNIFGNANKYTDTGFITVQLRICEIEKVNPATTQISYQHVLVMRIIDSGRGMSTEYMKRKLYTPFAQEDSFSPGIGLGLSIVYVCF
jgi:signal transduction histidine kinase